MNSTIRLPTPTLALPVSWLPTLTILVPRKDAPLPQISNRPKYSPDFSGGMILAKWLRLSAWMPPWKKTFISKSVEYQRDVVPIHFSGQNSERFYRIARFSDKYLPFNLAMLFLVDEMYRNVGKDFRIAFGKPIPWQTFDKSKTPTEWAQYVKDKVYEL